MLDEYPLQCPYCGEPITVLVDQSVPRQSYIEDCEVCCRPMLLEVVVSEADTVEVWARREDE